MTEYEAFRQSIVGCARCRGDGHEDVWWMPLTHSVELGGMNFTHWAPCPTNGQPILMTTHAEPDGLARGGEGTGSGEARD